MKTKPTQAQRASFRRSTSYGVLFVRSKLITKALGAAGKFVPAQNAGEPVTLSARRFGSIREASLHGKRFKRIEGHKAFHVVVNDRKPNAWINYRTGKTNPVIGDGRTNRR